MFTGARQRFGVVAHFSHWLDTAYKEANKTSKAFKSSPRVIRRDK
ncbi:hypothetical protein N172_13490 [Pantoea dispersa EGD-AAK13]|jgi:hypothetical protein|nr:hypothetical protein N172_13490 [Pantoea dispersa EGD-AAK13]